MLELDEDSPQSLPSVLDQAHGCLTHCTKLPGSRVLHSMSSIPDISVQSQCGEVDIPGKGYVQALQPRPGLIPLSTEKRGKSLSIKALFWTVMAFAARAPSGFG